ncbi:DUF2971 domain-containing protein [Acinetobacter tianfuensis]|uniref:DUF2971 domain-containing protein n=1 Tax=Acinetobacter tianfuensis TaxID=2419603 RepID=A0A3A8EJB0_9GAMM|nr:DUF2971 domain-containing protein [Acinetobacter tianfuensis]RKG34675.1 DUF2971 domain-containing protein [Acinetobacter tianfuensis]
MDDQYKEIMRINDTYTEDTIFYHYCSPETFLAICSGKKLRFSSLYQMNDHMEKQWGYNIWVEVINQLEHEKSIDLAFLKEITKIIFQESYFTLSLACCFSKDGDVLSQWRAYALDASGYSIGFSAKYLSKLPTRFIEVCYNKEEQKQIVENFIWYMYKRRIDNPNESKGHDSFIDLCVDFSVRLSGFKNSAFKEEQEIRMVHVIQIDRSDSKNPRYTFGGGIENGEKCKEYKINFRMNGSTPTPFIDIDFYHDINPIKEIILGPKNNSREIDVSLAINSLDFKNVKVKKSEASYR